jgi:Outer membrane protein beta-barrel domain
MRPTRLLFVALALLFASPAAAVETQVGFLAGGAFTKLSIDGQDGLDGQSSFAFGGVVDLGLNDRFGIRVEPTWMTKGGKATHRNAYWGTIDGAVFKIDCIDVPVLARYDLATTPIRGFLLGGLGVSFATSQEAELTFGNNHETVDFGDVFSPVDVTLDLGMGMSFPVNVNRMTIDGRASIGLVDINDGGTVTVAGSPLAVPSTSTHTLDFRLIATYLFPMGAK